MVRHGERKRKDDRETRGWREKKEKIDNMMLGDEIGSIWRGGARESDDQPDSWVVLAG